MIRIHFANAWGQCSSSGSGFDNSTVIIVTMNMPGANTTTASFASTTPNKINEPATNGEVTKAIVGNFHPRYI
jgi:hypothetical protein